MKKDNITLYKAIAKVVLASSITLVGCNTSENLVKPIMQEEVHEEQLTDTFVIKNGTIKYYDKEGNNNPDEFPKINSSDSYSVIEWDKNGESEILTYSGIQLAKILALYWGEGALGYIDIEEFPIVEYIGCATSEDQLNKDSKIIRI